MNPQVTGPNENAPEPLFSGERLFVVAVSALFAVLYALACGLPAVETVGSSLTGAYTGWECLADWTNLQFGPWWANPLALLALIALLFRKYRTAATLAVIAAHVAAGMLGAPETTLHAGYFFWQGSLVFLAVVTIWAAWYYDKGETVVCVHALRTRPASTSLEIPENSRPDSG